MPIHVSSNAAYLEMFVLLLEYTVQQLYDNNAIRLDE